jgi:DNA-binding CsgD family transcriptional regulator
MSLEASSVRFRAQRAQLEQPCDHLVRPLFSRRQCLKQWPKQAMVMAADGPNCRLKGGFSKMGAGTLILLNQPRCLPTPGFVLGNGTFTCGRSTQCDFVLPHPTVSRRHAELRVDGVRVEVVDLGSRNGTFLNGKRVKAEVIRLREVLQLGKVSFVLADGPSEDIDCESCRDTESAPEVQPLSNFTSPMSCLSIAQRRVLDLVLEGLVEKQIATRLKISRHTAHNHVRNIYRALNVHSRGELLARFVWKGDSDGPTAIRFELSKPADLLS